MISKALQSVGLSREPSLSPEDKLRRNIIRHEAKVGGTLFGPIPPGVYREFFCLDEYTWIWYEQWQESGKPKSRTTRYNIRNEGITKNQNGMGYKLVNREEALRLYQATRAYQIKVEKEVYRPILNAI